MLRRRKVRMLLTMALLTACSGDAAGERAEPARSAAATAAIPTPVTPTPQPSATPAPTATAVPQATAVPEASEPMLDPATDARTTEEDPVAPTPTTPADESQPDCLRLTEFSLDAENFGWFIVNDNVMGGRSSGGPTFADSVMVFEGEINTDGGGFSSVRAQIAPSTLAGFTHLIVRARVDDRTYKITLEDGLPGRDRRVSQQQALVFGEPDEDGWQTARIDFDQLVPKIFGRDVESEAFRPDLATQLGIMISDGVDGPFRIDVDSIDACR